MALPCHAQELQVPITKILIRAALGYPVHYNPTTRTVRTTPKEK